MTQEFIVEWPDDNLEVIYPRTLNDAVKHFSGWVMVNNNNHRREILKKSCRGVIMCHNNCHKGDRPLTLRPATVANGMLKQLQQNCPKCGKKSLFHRKCKGNRGYPVTHYWQTIEAGIRFSSKGIHDHPRPPNLKPPQAAILKLVHYMTDHPSANAKEISQDIGPSIHEAFAHENVIQRKFHQYRGGLRNGRREMFRGRRREGFHSREGIIPRQYPQLPGVYGFNSGGDYLYGGFHAPHEIGGPAGFHSYGHYYGGFEQNPENCFFPPYIMVDTSNQHRMYPGREEPDHYGWNFPPNQRRGRMNVMPE